MAQECAEASTVPVWAEGTFGGLDLSAVLDTIGDVVIVIDAHATIKAANRATRERLCNAQEDCVIGLSLLNFIPADEQASCREALQILTSGTSKAASLRLRLTPDRPGSSIDLVVYPYQTVEEALFILVGRNEGTRASSESLIGCAKMGRVRRWRFDVVTNKMKYDDDPKEYHRPTPTVHPDEQHVVQAVFKRAQVTREPMFFRARARDDHGRYKLIETYLFVECDSAGQPIAFSGVSHDITEAAAAMSALHDGLSELQEIFAEMSDFIVRMDVKGKAHYVSPSVKRVLGYEPKDIMTANVTHPDDASSLMEAIRSLRQVGQSIIVTHRNLHRDGHWVWIESTARALLIGADGQAAEIIIVSRDITERKCAEDELAAAYARAEAASATKSRFLANMSHELRTPLNAIIGFSEIIRRELFGPVGPARYKEYAQLIQDSGGHLLELINDILDMSKIEAGKFDLRLEPIDLDDLIRSSLKLVETRAQQARLIIALELGEDKPHIHADRRAIKQVLLNLLTNSIKFTPPGGAITISVQSLSDGIALQVRDTGIGIAEKDLPRVTMPFEQVTHDPMLAQAGSGLGLALVQSLVALHMGTLKIDSMPGEGTLVTVFLPIDPRSRKAA